MVLKMDIETFKKTIKTKKKEDLLTILNNTRTSKRPDAAEYEDAVRHQLDQGYPGWAESKKPKQGGRTPNRATFKELSGTFETAKEGYVWLVERCIKEVPEIFSNIDSKTYRVAVGRGRNYFARSPEKLFKAWPHLAEVNSNFQRLANGWYANLNLDNDKKFDVLCRLSWLANLDFGKEWDWVVDRATDDLSSRQKRQIMAQEA